MIPRLSSVPGPTLGKIANGPDRTLTLPYGCRLFLWGFFFFFFWWCHCDRLLILHCSSSTCCPFAIMSPTLIIAMETLSFSLFFSSLFFFFLHFLFYLFSQSPSSAIVNHFTPPQICAILRDSSSLLPI